MAAKNKRISEDKTFHVGYAVLHTSCSERLIFTKGCTYKHAWDVSLKSFRPFWFEAGIPRLYLDKCGTLYFQKKTLQAFSQFHSISEVNEVRQGSYSFWPDNSRRSEGVPGHNSNF